MRLTLVHPSIGRAKGQRYIRTWQMEPLGPATLAGLTPPGVEIRFHDDRMERIPFDEPTDLVALSVETYTAKRAYQIASEYRRRGVPVAMGGFHATLCPEEVARFAETIVLGEAEEVWPRLCEDFASGHLQRVYRSGGRPSLAGHRPDRSIFEGKRYLPIGLVEAGRGCHFQCDFCAIQSFFSSTQNRRPIDDVLAEVQEARRGKKLIFFVDDNITSNLAEAKAFFRALAPLKIRWVSQASINAAHDDEFLRLIKASGCEGLLIGFESLDPDNLEAMGKSFNGMKGGYEVALSNLRRHGIRLYPTFIFGYDHDRRESFAETISFAIRHRFYIAAFNHLTPFPGTPLYDRLQREGRLRFERWWLDDRYRYNMLPFSPRNLDPEEVRLGCVQARREFFSWRSTVRRSFDRVNAGSLFMFWNFFFLNAMFRAEVHQRDGHPLGDEAWEGELLETDRAVPTSYDPITTTAQPHRLRSKAGARPKADAPLQGSVTALE